MRFKDCVGTFLEWSGTSHDCAYCLIRVFQAFIFLSEDSAMQWGFKRKFTQNADFADTISPHKSVVHREAKLRIAPLQHQHGFRSTL